MLGGSQFAEHVPSIIIVTDPRARIRSHQCAKMIGNGNLADFPTVCIVFQIRATGVENDALAVPELTFGKNFQHRVDPASVGPALTFGAVIQIAAGFFTLMSRVPAVSILPAFHEMESVLAPAPVVAPESSGEQAVSEVA